MQHRGLEAIGAEHPKEAAHPSGRGDSLEHGLCPVKVLGRFYFSAPRGAQPLPAPCSLETLHTGYLGINWGDGLPFPSLIPIFRDTCLALLPSEPGSGMSLCVILPVPCTEPLISPRPAQPWVHVVLPREGGQTTCSPVPSHLVLLLQGKEMLTQKLPLWQQSCSDPNKIPERAIQLMQQMAASSNGTIMPSPLSTSKSNLIISDPIPGAKPLPVPPELAPFVGVSISGGSCPALLSKAGGTRPGRCHRCPRQVALGWTVTDGRDGQLCAGPSWDVGRSLTLSCPIPPESLSSGRAGAPRRCLGNAGAGPACPGWSLNCGMQDPSEESVPLMWELSIELSRELSGSGELRAVRHHRGDPTALPRAVWFGWELNPAGRSSNLPLSLELCPTGELQWDGPGAAGDALMKPLGVPLPSCLVAHVGAGGHASDERSLRL